MAELLIEYTPLPMQKAFHQSKAKYRFYVGGFGSGKTLCLAMEALKVAMTYPGSFGAITRKTYPELRDTTRRTFFEICPQDIIREWRPSENHLKLTNGSEILFRPLDEPDKLKSLNLDWFAIDEGSETTKDIFDMLRGRLRGVFGPRKGWVVSNPEGHNWIWEVCVKDKKEDYDLVVAPTTENIHLPKEYIDDLLNSPEVWKKRYVYGMFDAFEGQIFDMFSEENIIPQFTPAPEWERVIAVDHGFRNPTAAIFGAIDFDGNIFIYDEYYEAGQLVSYHADKIRRKVLGIPPKERAIFIPGTDINSEQRKWDFQYITVLIDPSTRNRNPVTGLSVQAEYADYRFNCIDANNEVLAGINRVGEYFFKKKLFITKNCVNLLEEIRGYKWEGRDLSVDEKPVAEKPLKVKDHAVDALRYLIMSRPQLPKELIPQKGKTYSEEVWEWLKNKNKNKRQHDILGEV